MVDGWKLNPPPGWPPPPDGWVPPEGWEPDPAWGPVPAGWRLWRPEGGPPPPRPRRTLALGLAALVAIGVIAVAVPRQGLGSPPDAAARFGLVQPVDAAGPGSLRAAHPRAHPEPTRTRRTIRLKQRQAQERARRRAGLEKRAAQQRKALRKQRTTGRNPARPFGTCAALNAAYPHGLGRPDAVDLVAGAAAGRPVTGFGRSVALYTANRRLDRDHDMIACEHG